MDSIQFRELVVGDVEPVVKLLTGVRLFPSEMVAGLNEMMQAHCAGHLGDDYRWIVAEWSGRTVAVACYAAEQFADRAWNLLLIAIDHESQGKGWGSQVLMHVEQTLVDSGGRLLLIETSALDSFERTRAFYSKHGYQKVGQIPNYYQQGDDKIIYCKSLSQGE